METNLGTAKKDLSYYSTLPYSVLLHETQEDNEKYWIAEVPELPGCKSHGATVEEAMKNVAEAKSDWISDSLEHGEEVPEPIQRDKFSGKTLVRMSRSLHRALSLMADTERLSLNQLIVTILAKEVGRFDVLNQVSNKVDRLLKDMKETAQEKNVVWYVRGNELASLGEDSRQIGNWESEAGMVFVGEPVDTWQDAPTVSRALLAHPWGMTGQVADAIVRGRRPARAERVEK